MTMLRRLGRLITYARFHLVMACVWALLLVPTLIWWKSSILWVAAMSLYANFVGHWSASHAAKAQEQEEAGQGGT